MPCPFCSVRNGERMKIQKLGHSLEKQLGSGRYSETDVIKRVEDDCPKGDTSLERHRLFCFHINVISMQRGEGFSCAGMALLIQIMKREYKYSCLLIPSMNDRLNPHIETRWILVHLQVFIKKKNSTTKIIE